MIAIDPRLAARASLLAGVLLASWLGAWIAPHDPARQFADASYAPPMRPHVIDDTGAWHAPFVYPLRLENRLERRFGEDRSVRRPLRWFTDGALVSIDEASGPWLPLGGDSLGRDLLARAVRGTRTSLALAAVAGLGAMALGALVGAVAGYAGGRVDELLMRLADFVVVLPAVYVVLALRASLPLVLSPAEVFWSMAGVLAAAGWPYPARGVRAIVAAERRKEYAESARAAGAGSTRILLRHLLPATRGFLTVQATLLLPAFILAEATLSFAGLGIPEPAPSLGWMLRDAAQAGALIDAPWLLLPALAIVLSILGLHLLAGHGTRVHVPARSTN